MRESEWEERGRDGAEMRVHVNLLDMSMRVYFWYNHVDE